MEYDEKDDEVVRIAERIEHSYAYFRAVLNTDDISAWLTERAGALGALTLRATGGFYFIPRGRTLLWEDVKKILESVSSNVVYTMHVLHASDAIESVMAALVAEAESQATKIEGEIATLGKRGLGNRAQKVVDLREKVGDYEALLGKHATNLHDRLEHLQAAVAQAILVANEGEDD
jgi:hypothetical protein